VGEHFNIDLPFRFQFTETEQDKKDVELEDYLNKLGIQLDEMFKRLFNRVSEPISWSIHTLSNDATPSVEGGRLWLTGGTTTVTDFDDGIEGQAITVIAEHAITITHGTNIFLNGAANFVMAVKDTLTLQCKADNKWYEIGRSDNT
jgi:hypothetical protein